MKKKVLVAMSGGVDSSVAAYLLKEGGFKVAGLTMCLGVKKVSERRPTCCGEQAVRDAKEVCLKLGIPHYVLDFSRYLEKKVIDKFVIEYLAGRTPNPCIDCNRTLKFGILLKKAISLGFDFLATGHYAKIAKKGKSYVLKRAKDEKKDQSYFLYCIEKKSLGSVIFPLGEFTKEKVRSMAKKARLPVHDKPQSQDICFIPDRKYHRFLSERIRKKPLEGRILNLDGNVLGKHKGAVFYTIGQRGGLGVGYKHPLYVVSLDTARNELVVGKRKDLRSKALLASEVNILAEKLPKRAYAKIRYNHKEAKCEIAKEKDRLKVIFAKPQEAITPGQSVVFYDKDTVLGGGVIDRAIRR